MEIVLVVEKAERMATTVINATTQACRGRHRDDPTGRACIHHTHPGRNDSEPGTREGGALFSPLALRPRFSLETNNARGR